MLIARNVPSEVRLCHTRRLCAREGLAAAQQGLLRVAAPRSDEGEHASLVFKDDKLMTALIPALTP